MANDQSAGRSVRIALIAAVGRDGTIGARGDLPWRLPSDLAWFRNITIGKPLILGRKTYESLKRPLPGRRVIVITRDLAWTRPEIEVAASLPQALDLAAGAEEILIGGGGEIYALALPYATRLYLTEVDLAPAGDVSFPPFDRTQWREIQREKVPRSEKDAADFDIVIYDKIIPTS